MITAANVALHGTQTKHTNGRDRQDGFEEAEEAYQFDFIPPQELQRICCPITGLPMRDPVLAADGQAYERYALCCVVWCVCGQPQTRPRSTNTNNPPLPLNK